MLYMLFICESEAEAARRSAAEEAALALDCRRIAERLTAAGKYRGGGRLEPTRTATTVRVRGGKTLVTDGPFAETHEQLGGYVLVEATDLDDALAIAARIPAAASGSIEVRPLQAGDDPAA